MEIRQLECFVRVVEQGGFTRAGIALNMAQPALSRQVRALEEELGAPLLKRHGRGAEPTEAGRVFLEHAYGVLRQVAQAKEAVSQAGAAMAGQCGVGLPPSVARLLAVPLVAAVRRAAPKAKLTLSEGLSSRLVEWILAGRLDVALAFNPPRHADLITSHVLDEERWLTTSAKSPPKALAGKGAASVSLAQVMAMPLILPTRPNATRMLLEKQVGRDKLDAAVALEVDGVPAILDLVAQGEGVALLPASAVRTTPNPQAFRLTRLTGKPLVSTLTLAYPARRPISGLHATVARQLSALAKTHLLQ